MQQGEWERDVRQARAICERVVVDESQKPVCVWVSQVACSSQCCASDMAFHWLLS